jgi:hypothetical protein
VHAWIEWDKDSFVEKKPSNEGKNEGSGKRLGETVVTGMMWSKCVGREGSVSGVYFMYLPFLSVSKAVSLCRGGKFG